MLRFAVFVVVVAAAAAVGSSSSSSLKSFSPSLASAPDSESLSATRISLMGSSSSWIFFPSLCSTPTMVCNIETPMPGHSCRNLMP